MPVSWQTRFFSLSATLTLRWIVSRTRLPGDGRLAAARVGERVAEVLRDVLQRPDVEVRGGVLDGVLQIGGDRAHAPRFLGGGAAGAAAEDDALEQRVAHHAVPPVGAAGDLAAGVHALERRLGVRVDHETAVLVVEDGVGEDLLGERVDAAGAVAAQHVRERHVGVGLGDARRVEVDRRAAVGRLDAAARRDLVDDRLRDHVARAERVGELLAVGVQQHGAVGARRLGDRVALHRSPATRRRSGGTGARRGRAPRRRARARARSPRRSRRDGWSRARRAPAPTR